MLYLKTNKYPPLASSASWRLKKIRSILLILSKKPEVRSKKFLLRALRDFVVKNGPSIEPYNSESYRYVYFASGWNETMAAVQPWPRQPLNGWDIKASPC